MRRWGRGPGRRSHRRRVLVAVATVLAALALPGCGATWSAAPGEVVVPLTFVPEANRLIADIEVGGAPLRVLVDTGSVGLRVVADRVPAAATAPVGPAAPVAYGSGVELAGTVARTPVRIGPLRSGPVPVELVSGTACVPEQPRCPAAGGREPEMFGGRYDGILGIGVAGPPQVPNPLWYLGPVGHAFTIHHDPDDTSALVLGASPTGFDLARLAPLPARVPDGPPVWVPRIPVCVGAAPLPGGRSCGPTLLDTGTPLFMLVNAAGAAQEPLPRGTSVTVASPEGRWSTSSVTGPEAPSWVGGPPTGNPGSVAGLPFFARADVRFDLDAGTVGVRTRAS